MSDRICTNCRGQTAIGCWLCNPDLHQAELAAMSGDCVKCRQYKQRIAELEAGWNTAVNKWKQERERIAELERVINEFHQVCPDVHPYAFYTAPSECMECKAEARLDAVKKLPEQWRKRVMQYDAATANDTCAYELEQALGGDDA